MLFTQYHDIHNFTVHETKEVDSYLKHAKSWNTTTTFLFIVITRHEHGIFLHVFTKSDCRFFVDHVINPDIPRCIFEDRSVPRSYSIDGTDIDTTT